MVCHAHYQPYSFLLLTLLIFPHLHAHTADLPAEKYYRDSILNARFPLLTL